MATWLKQSTSVDVGIGPFLDETDGKTAETALTITQPDVRLKKNNGAWAQKAAAQTLTHEEAGWYEVTLDATDTNTLGILIVAIHEAGALPVWREFLVVPANVWDSYLGADRLQVHAAEITNDLLTAASLNADAGTEIAAAVWNALRSAHLAAGSFGQAAQATRMATAAAGGVDSITLDASASASNDFYNGLWIAIVAGTGAGQIRKILDYVGATKVVTIDAPNWATIPDNTSVFAVF